VQSVTWGLGARQLPLLLRGVRVLRHPAP